MCTVCGRQFHRSDYLKLHSYSHTDERPFNCHICGKGFKMNYNLKVHLKNHDHDLTNATIISSNEDTTTFNISESSMNSSNYIDNHQDNHILGHNKQQVKTSFINASSLVNNHHHQQQCNQTMNFNLEEVNGGLLQSTMNTNEMVSFIMNGNDLSGHEIVRPINLMNSRSFESVAKINLIQSHEEDSQMLGHH